MCTLHGRDACTTVCRQCTTRIACDHPRAHARSPCASVCPIASASKQFFAGHTDHDHASYPGYKQSLHPGLLIVQPFQGSICSDPTKGRPTPRRVLCGKRHSELRQKMKPVRSCSKPETVAVALTQTPNPERVQL